MAALDLRPRRSRTANVKSARPSKKRAASKRVSYTEPSSDPEDDSSQDDFEPKLPAPLRRGRSAAYPIPTIPRKRKVPSQGRGRPKIHNIGAPTKLRDKEKKTSKKHHDIKFTGRTMPWQTLPYHILEAIFDYASYPLIDENFLTNSSATWLTQIARLCKSFAEPALSALYASPPLHPPSRVRHLIERLEEQNIASFLDYRAKIKRIDIEVVEVLARKSDGLEPIELGRLLALTPRLRGAGLHLLSDNPRLHPRLVHRHIGKVNPIDLIHVLTCNRISLQDWTWNGSMRALLPFCMQHILKTHQAPSFQNLRTLSFINCQSITFDQEGNQDVDGGELLAKSLEALPNLRNLRLKKSFLLKRLLLENCSIYLESLEIDDCLLNENTVEMILQGKGQNLRHLTLNHNRDLNLSWLNNLAAYCPQLESLRMDLIYHSLYATVSDSEPGYKYLLWPEDKPTWPASLQHLELYQLRKWETSVADNFFWSLVNAAPTLTNLRQLKIKASLDESGWRDRVAFRDRWTQRLKDIFLRNPAQPSPHLKSLAAFKEWKVCQQNGTTISNGARLQHVQIPVCKLDDDTKPEDHEIGSDSDKPLLNVRRSRRTRPAKNYNENDSDHRNSCSSRQRPRRRCRVNPNGSSEVDSAIEDDAMEFVSLRHDLTADAEEEGLHRQGMCDVVDVLIDNLRPTEEQLHESDFLDEEISGDEDWNGDDDLADEGGYAW